MFSKILNIIIATIFGWLSYFQKAAEYDELQELYTKDVSCCAEIYQNRIELLGELTEAQETITTLWYPAIGECHPCFASVVSSCQVTVHAVM